MSSSSLVHNSNHLSELAFQGHGNWFIIHQNFAEQRGSFKNDNENKDKDLKQKK